MPERLLSWLYEITRRYWLTSVILGTMISVMVMSIQQARWVQDEAALATALMVGIFFGILLASSRFRGWFAALYSIMISLIIITQAVGHILPAFRDLFTHPFFEVVEQMNLRIVTTSLRISSWIEVLRAGENVQDTGLFVLLLGTMLSLSGIWLMWAIMRRRSVLLGLLPVGILYAINVHLGRQPLTNYMVFLFCALLLIARTEYNRQHEEWQYRRVDYPEQLGLEWGGSAMAAAMIIIFFARLSPLLGTPDGWRAISDWVNRAQEQTNTTATRLFSGVNPPPPDPAQEPEVFVNTPNLGQIGAPIAQGEKTIMWVSISDPAPPPQVPGMIGPTTNTRVHYWRNNIYSTYNGRGWEPAPLGSVVSPAEALPEQPPVGRYYLRQTFVLEARNSGTLFATNDPVSADRDVALRSIGTDDASSLVEGKTYMYQVISEATSISSRLLAGSSTDYPPEIRNTYLQLPETLPERVRTLAVRITGTDDPYHKALKIQNYLRENYLYDLSVPEAPANRDVVDYFLFDAPGGFCSHYASSMAVMLRAVGVPARVATGYAMGEYDPERQSYRVPESASHAWVEVYFHGYGWVEFEPTNSRSPIEYTNDTPENNPSAPGVSLDAEPPLQAQPYFAVLLLVAALVLIALPFLLLRMFSTTRQPPVIQVDVLYHRMRRALGWAGLDAVSSTTPDEYLSLYDDRLEKYQRLNKALRQATALYRETVYSPRLPDPIRVRIVSQLWQSAFREWLSLWLRAAWQRLRARFSE